MDDQVSIPEPRLIADNIKPIVGMEFESLDDAYDFYNRYAWETGFSIRRGKTTHRKDTRELMDKYFLCGKEGASLVSGTQRLHSVGREHCKAKVVMLKKRDSAVWKISQFIEQHNHMLTSPRRIGLLRSHREVSAAKKRLTMELSQVNIPIYKQIDLYEVQSGGIQNMGCTETDIRNYQRDLRKETDGHDVQLLEEHFRYQKSENSSFYYSLDLDDDNVLDKCFWADAYSRRSYGCCTLCGKTGHDKRNCIGVSEGDQREGQHDCYPFSSRGSVVSSEIDLSIEIDLLFESDVPFDFVVRFGSVLSQ